MLRTRKGPRSREHAAFTSPRAGQAGERALVGTTFGRHGQATRKAPVSDRRSGGQECNAELDTLGRIAVTQPEWDAKTKLGLKARRHRAVAGDPYRAAPLGPGTSSNCPDRAIRVSAF